MRKFIFITLGLLIFTPLYSHALPPPLSSGFDFSACPTIGYGKTRTGECVRMLQDFLNNQGFNSGFTDGKFGPKTRNALIAFQKANNLSSDGIAGKKTFGKITVLQGGQAVVPSSSCFVSPQAGETWPFGSTNTIQLKNSPVYNSHCSNTFSLINTTTNQRVGYLGIQSNPGQSSYLWTSTDTIFSFSCGTSGDEFPAYVSPGQYKIRFEEQDTVIGTGLAVSCESDTITIN